MALIGSVIMMLVVILAFKAAVMLVLAGCILIKRKFLNKG